MPQQYICKLQDPEQLKLNIYQLDLLLETEITCKRQRAEGILNLISYFCKAP